MRVAHVSLSNFRNYERLELALGPGMTVFEGGNGAGKSNLLEALYMLAVGRSPRAGSDRELLRRGAASGDGGAGGEAYAQVGARVERGDDPVRLQIHIRGMDGGGLGGVGAGGSGASGGRGGRGAQKLFRVNGAPRRASGFVGHLNAVMFSADDLQIVFGPPSARRRYLNILISQTDRQYLRALQRYERVVQQRNHLLRRIRDGEAGADELGFWDDQLVEEGARITAKRGVCARALSALAQPIYGELSGGGETMAMAYEPNAGTDGGAGDLAGSDGAGGSAGDDGAGDLAGAEAAIGERMRGLLAERRVAELARGVSLAGPHRDELRLTVDGMEAASFASRGQTRSAALALKLAEAGHLRERRGEEPALLMDDVLSELDAGRRLHVLESAAGYGQTLVTTADAGAIDGRFLRRAARYAVRGGRVERMGGGG